MRVPMSVVKAFASRCYWDTEPNFVAGRKLFVEGVNKQVAQTCKLSLRFHPELASQLFSALWEDPVNFRLKGGNGERHDAAHRRQRLVEAGYLMVRDSSRFDS